MLSGKRGIFLHIYPGDLHPAGIFGRDLIEQRGQHLALAAPLRPEIHNDRLGRIENLALEIRLVDFDDVLHCLSLAASWFFTGATLGESCW